MDIEKPHIKITYVEIKAVVMLLGIIVALVMSYKKNGTDGVITTAGQIAMSPLVLDIGLANATITPTCPTGGFNGQ